MGRRVATELITPRIASGKRVWCSGHWGFQWYAEKAGAMSLSGTPPFPTRGDIIVSSAVDRSAALQNAPRRRLLQTVRDATPGGRIMSIPANAGFYSNGWGYFPWAWGTGEINRCEVWQVE